MYRIRIFAAGLAALFLATPAGAKSVDQYGVVVFNQADVNAGGITPGDTPGFPASLLVSGHYRLSGPLTLTSLKNGIVISAPAVTMDLGGFKVSGAAVGRTGVYTDQVDTAISNGIIRGFTLHGIEASGDFLKIIGVSVTKNGGLGLRIFDADFARVTDSTIVDNTFSGIECGFNCSVQNSTISRNQGDGVYVAGQGNVLGNVITDNNGRGLTGAVTGYGNNIITGNGAAQISGTLIALNPNACVPACPAPAP